MTQSYVVTKPIIDEESGRPVVDENGTPKTEDITIKVIRSWATLSGKQISLRVDGHYIYKDGSPVKTREELNDPELIGDPQQRKLATAWFDTYGAKIAKDYYDKQSELRRKALEYGTPMMQVSTTDADAALYIRRLKTQKQRKFFGDPTPWMNWFPKRPAWWGAVDKCDVGEHHYEKVDLSDPNQLAHAREWQEDNPDLVAAGRTKTIIDLKAGDQGAPAD